MRIQEFAQVDEQLEDEIVGSEYATLQDTFASVAAALPAVQLSSEPSTRLTSFDTLDFKVLVRQRKEHQTRQAARSARVKNSRPDDEPSAAPPESMRCQILRKYHELLKEDQSKAAGTVVERQARWTTDPIPAAGNAANAAATAAAVATKAAIRPRKLFQDAKLPPSLLKEVESAGLTNFNPVRIDSYGIIWTEIGLRVGRVDALYSKGGGKNGKHGNVTEHHNISALSYLIVQVFELTHARTFRAHPQATSLFRTLQFRQLLPFTFLCRLSDAPIITPTGIELSLADATLFKELNSAIQHFDTAVKLSRSRKKAKELAEEEEVDTTVGF
ncbi:hypothetical protein K438DRAFT_1851749 [Mycena galopus ATCC 62051]|nr:hypothetical protein K438DRAFT_1851749 [Mycena galopus ATCC 62051]